MTADEIEIYCEMHAGGVVLRRDNGRACKDGAVLR